MNTTAKTAQMMARLAEAETTAKVAGREETRTAGRADRAAARLTTARAATATARRELRTATRTGKGLAAAERRVERLTARCATLATAAQDANAEATTARRAARTATRRLDTLARRAARSAARTVEKIAHRLGETSLTPAAETDRILAAEELPAAEEIEATAAAYDDLDQRAKNLAKQADAMKTWLRALPVGTYGRVVITRTPGRSVLDSAQIALDYAARGQMPPRKATRTTFKCDATALRADLAPAA
ncbi:hypothetical protein [Streptomyces zaomyceticus]|uniref:hypothetical protein n=1 Tax=Streptomyces zaomyceticus TaxID=68286 RepID=UPI003799BB04